MYYMFGVCESLTSLDVSNFNTEKVESMGGMFYCCRNIKVLDLSSFDTSNVTNMGADGHTQGMFELCDNLTTIYASELWSVENVTISERMFFNCFNLVGKVAYGEGTGGDLENANYETGYLTYKAAPTKE